MIKCRKIIAAILCFLLFFEQSGFAQVAEQLNISAYLSTLRSSLAQERFRPIHLRFMEYDVASDNFGLLLDKENVKGLTPSLAKETTEKLLEYFLIGITLPDDSFWVNLRPDAPEDIIDPFLEQTDIGKIFLEADLQLKKDTALATSPQTPEGKEYWDKLYLKAEELFGNQNVTIPALTRPWIVPDEIIIRQTNQNAYIYKATLKVMLEQDYLKQNRGRNSIDYSFKDDRLRQLNEYATQLLKERIIPKLTKEINTSKRYAPLRQVYYSLILAQWFKKSFSGKQSFYASLINRRSLRGLESRQPWSKEEYFRQYQKSFTGGEYNLEFAQQRPAGKVIRTYFCGGISLVDMPFSAIYPAGGKEVLPSSLSQNGPRLTTRKGNPLPQVQVDVSSLSPAQGQDLKIHILPSPISIPPFSPEEHLLNLAKDLVERIPRDELLSILQNISGRHLKWKDIAGDVYLSYLSKGSHKYVFKVQFSLRDGNSLSAVLALKKEINKNDITSHELNNLKMLRGKGVPKFGGSGVFSDGRRWYIEEFIEGTTARELLDKNLLSERMRKQIVKTVLAIAVGLGGMVPRDIHPANFVFRKDTQEAVMVDIGEKRLYIADNPANKEHKLLFLAILMFQYGFKDYGQQGKDDFIFEEILSHPNFGIKLLKDAHSFSNSLGEEKITKLFTTKATNMFWYLGTPPNARFLGKFTRHFLNSLNAFMAKIETRRGPPAPDSSFEGVSILEEIARAAYEQAKDNPLAEERISHLQDMLVNYFGVVPKILLLSRSRLDELGISKDNHIIRYKNNIIIEEEYYNQYLSRQIPNQEALENAAKGEAAIDPLLNVLVHEATAYRLEQKGAIAGTLPVEAEGKVNLRDWEARYKAHEGLEIDRSIEGERNKDNDGAVKIDSLPEELSRYFGDDETAKKVLSFILRSSGIDTIKAINGYRNELIRESGGRLVYKHTILLSENKEVIFYTKESDKRRGEEISLMTQDNLKAEEENTNKAHIYGLAPAALTINHKSKGIILVLSNAEGVSLGSIDFSKVKNENIQRIIRQMGYDIGRLHGVGIVHGDLVDGDAFSGYFLQKPHMLITGDGRVRFIDFGSVGRFTVEEEFNGCCVAIAEFFATFGLSISKTKELFAEGYKEGLTNNKKDLQTGGIDFRSLPINVQSPPALRDTYMRQNYYGRRVSISSVNQEWEEIERMLNAGIIPSTERIRRYLINCADKDFFIERDRIIGCIADILREEEMRADYTPAYLKAMLMLLETTTNASTLKIALAKIEVSPRHQPKT